MELFLLIGLSLCITMVTVTFGCMRCRRKLSEEEKQQKAFEKFKKRHMLPRDRVLTNRVDVIRNVPLFEEKIPSVRPPSVDQTYEELKPPNPPAPASNSTSPREHSFFDDSFQTVIEASSSNITSSSNGAFNPTLPTLLVPRTRNISSLASYISFQADVTGSHICLNSCAEVQQQDRGETNPGFIEDSKLTMSDDDDVNDDDSDSSGSSSSSYLKPNCIPSIMVTKPSIKRRSNDSVFLSIDVDKGTAVEEDLVKGDEDVEAKLDAEPSLNYCTKLTTHDETLLSNLSIDQITEKVPDKNIQKLLMEGQQCYEKSKISDYEQLHSRNNRRKSSYATIMLPKLHKGRSIKSSIESTISGGLEHTYESLTDALANEMSRGEDFEVQHSQVGTPVSSKVRSVNSSGVVISDKDRTRSGSENTYESLHWDSQNAEGKASTSTDTGVVIIGRKATHGYEAVSAEKDKAKHNITQDGLDRLSFSSQKLRMDCDDRYSPFPNAKKLAIKSTLKQTASPRISIIPTLAHDIRPFLMRRFEASSRSLILERSQVKTPEIIVQNSPRCFELDATVFLSPRRILPKTCSPDIGANPMDEVSAAISPLCTYETMKMCSNMKVTDSARGYRGSSKSKHASLPSLPDDFDEELQKYCGYNDFIVSTPCEVSEHVCQV